MAAIRGPSFPSPVGNNIVMFQTDTSTPSVNINAVSPLDNIGSDRPIYCNTTSHADLPRGSVDRSIDSTSVPELRKEETQQEGQTLIKNLGDSKTTLAYLNHEVSIVREVESLLGETDRSGQIRGLLQKAVKITASQLRDMLNNSTNLRSRVKGTYKRLFHSQLLTLVNDIWIQNSGGVDFRKQSTSTTGELIQPDTQIWKESYELNKTTTHSIAEFISPFVGGNMPSTCPSVIFSLEEAVVKYQQAADDLQHCIEKINVEIAYCRPLLASDLSPSLQLKAYNAVHLAYKTGDYRVFRSLCEKRASLFETDMLERTTLHYAVDNNDIRTVRFLIGLDREIVWKTRPDIAGLTPVALAAMRDNVEMFEELIGGYADDQPVSSPLLWSEFRSALGIALRCGSEHIAALMLKRKLYHAFASSVSDLMKAIEGQREDFARLVLQVLKRQVVLDEEQLRCATAAARQQGFHNLVEDLHKELQQLNNATRLAACSGFEDQYFEQFDTLMNYSSVDSQLDGTSVQFPICGSDTDVGSSKEAQHQTFFTSDNLNWNANLPTSNDPLSNCSNFSNILPVANLPSESQSTQDWHSSNGIPLATNADESDVDLMSSIRYPLTHTQTYIKYGSGQTHPEFRPPSQPPSEPQITNSHSDFSTGFQFSYPT